MSDAARLSHAGEVCGTRAAIVESEQRSNARLPDSVAQDEETNLAVPGSLAVKTSTGACVTPESRIKSSMLFQMSHCPKDEVIGLPFNLATRQSAAPNQQSYLIRVILHPPTGDRG